MVAATASRHPTTHAVRLDGLLDLRRICRDAGMSEHAKWGHPTYLHAGRNIVIVGAFRDDFRLPLIARVLRLIASRGS